jgi:hypothetical protein
MYTYSLQQRTQTYAHCCTEKAGNAAAIICRSRTEQQYKQEQACTPHTATDLKQTDRGFPWHIVEPFLLLTTLTSKIITNVTDFTDYLLTVWVVDLITKA